MVEEKPEALREADHGGDSNRTWKLYYDGGCNLCHESKLRAEKWARQAGQPLLVNTLQSPEAVEKGYDPENMVLEADGKVYKRGDAGLRILSIAPWHLRWLSWFRRTPPTRAIARFFYDLIANNRHRLWGKKSCGLPNAKSNERTDQASTPGGGGIDEESERGL